VTAARALGWSEADLQSAVLDLCRRLRLLTYHTHDSRRSHPGWPDLVIVEPRSGALLFVELKTNTGRLSPAQQAWLHALGRRHLALVWRVEDWRSGHITELLQAFARGAVLPS
jgi:hypothetical protein